MSTEQLQILFYAPPASHGDFELDWIQYLLAPNNITYVNSFSDINFLDSASVVLIARSGSGYEFIIDRFISLGIHFGVFLLSDERFIDAMPYISSRYCMFIYRNYYKPITHFSSKLRHFALGYKNGIQSSIKPILSRRYVWSFCGASRSHRIKACSFFKDIHPHHLKFTSTFNDPHGLNTSDYMALLSNSMFSICPVGAISTDTFRLYESLELGSIPIALSSDQYYLYLPSYWRSIFPSQPPFLHAQNWSTVRASLLHTLSSPFLLTSLQSSVIAFWNSYKYSLKQSISSDLSILASAASHSSITSLHISNPFSTSVLRLPRLRALKLSLRSINPF